MNSFFILKSPYSKEKIRMLKRTKFCAVLGNALEVYDFALYGFFAGTFAYYFFPKENSITALLASCAVFASGFIMRPFGSLFFGYWGDKYGRKSALTISIFITGFSTFLVSILPTYATWGIGASFLLVICRLAQGFGMGGEYNGASIFLVEHYSAQNERGYASSLIIASGALGALFAVGMTFGIKKILPSYDWAWRIPFLVGSLLSVLGYYMRQYLKESPEFIPSTSMQKSSYLPLVHVFKVYYSSLAVAMPIGGCQGALAYFLLSHSNIYLLQAWNFDPSFILGGNACGLAAHFMALLISGRVSDRWGYAVTIQSMGVILLLVIYPIFLLLHAGHLLFFFIALGVCAGLFLGPMNAYLNTLFPAEVRYSGIAFGYMVGSALFGGTMPLITSYYIYETHNLMVPAFYLMSLIFIVLAAISLKEVSLRKLSFKK
jgi:MHS family proline/betaine transporter-like MFS transporter